MLTTGGCAPTAAVMITSGHRAIRMQARMTGPAGRPGTPASAAAPSTSRLASLERCARIRSAIPSATSAVMPAGTSAPNAARMIAARRSLARGRSCPLAGLSPRMA